MVKQTQFFAFLKKRGSLGLVTAVFFLLAVYGLIASSNILFIVGLFTILSIYSRIYSCKAPLDISVIGIGSICIAVISDVWLAAIFGLSIWLVTMVWQPYIEFSYQIPHAIASFIVMFFFPIFISYAGKNLVLIAVSYGVAKFVIESMVFTPLLRPATIIPDLIFNLQELPFTIFYTALVMQFFAGPILLSLGIPGWETGSLWLFIKTIF
ncbi:TPA: hypothetical protein H1011_00360 [archaeon]|jgi:hypothetical protein|uniref:Uncharacterized protein n=1 Tax=Candidatus Undinarchaeum marinum TaxID=2756141 RepID=A0A832UYW7_9ARCH|nr:hypothetical protein [Candidatus Undinarchaeum marinum]